jgi:IS30 family transposase
VDIDESPAIEQRGRIGGRGGDAIIGIGRQSALLAMVERQAPMEADIYFLHPYATWGAWNR